MPLGATGRHQGGRFGRAFAAKPVEQRELVEALGGLRRKFVADRVETIKSAVWTFGLHGAFSRLSAAGFLLITMLPQKFFARPHVSDPEHAATAENICPVRLSNEAISQCQNQVRQMRVVSLTCSNTEIVCALGCSDMLVGVDNHSDYPPEVVERLPCVGPDLQVDIQKVAELKPDLVLASLTVPGHEEIVAGLEQANLPFLAPEPVSLEDVYVDIDAIGNAIHAHRSAKKLIAEMRCEFEQIPPSRSQPSLLIQWWPKPVIAPGKLSWVDDLIRLAGMSNPIGDREVKSAPLADSEVAKLNPNAVAISWCGVRYEKYRPKVVYRNPEFANTDFVRNGTVYRISEAYLGRPAPRLVEGFRQICRIREDLESRIPTRQARA